TATDNAIVASEALQGWASGFLVKKDAASQLCEALNEVLRGRKYVTPSLRARLHENFERRPAGDAPRKLTPRQREVLQLLAEAHSKKEPAAILDLTARTVAFHKYKIMEDLGLKTNADLVCLAIRERLRYTP